MYRHNIWTKGFCAPEKYPFLKSSIDNFYLEDHRILSSKNKNAYLYN